MDASRTKVSRLKTSNRYINLISFYSLFSFLFLKRGNQILFQHCISNFIPFMQLQCIFLFLWIQDNCNIKLKHLTSNFFKSCTCIQYIRILVIARSDSVHSTNIFSANCCNKIAMIDDGRNEFNPLEYHSTGF